MGSHLPGRADLPTPDIFVEFAHIYANEVFAEEQSRSIEVMREWLDRESTPESLVVSAVLIDELHVDNATLDVMEFVREILRRDLAPDHVVFEGKLADVAHRLLMDLSSNPGIKVGWQKFKDKNACLLTDDQGSIGLVSNHEGPSEWTCAMLSAAWTLCRAGVVDFPHGSIVSLTQAPTRGRRIVSVLHERYRGVEAKVTRILRAAGHEDVLSRVENVFFS